MALNKKIEEVKNSIIAGENRKSARSYDATRHDMAFK